MGISKHLFIPRFRCTASIEQKSRGMNKLNFITNAVSFINKQVIYRWRKSFVFSYSLILIRRITDDKIKLHVVLSFLYSDKGAASVGAPIVDPAFGLRPLGDIFVKIVE